MDKEKIKRDIEKYDEMMINHMTEAYPMSKYEWASEQKEKLEWLLEYCK